MATEMNAVLLSMKIYFSNEMAMLRMCGVTRKDKITIEHIRRTKRVAHASKKITETIELVRACDEDR